MDLAPLISAIAGGITLTGALILALVRYLTSDAGYRDLIGELRADNAELRGELDKVQQQLRDADQRAQRREAELLDEVRRLQRMMAGPPPPAPDRWRPPRSDP